MVRPGVGLYSHRSFGAGLVFGPVAATVNLRSANRDGATQQWAVVGSS